MKSCPRAWPAAQILEARGAYYALYGAGLSVEAGVPTADGICKDIAKQQLVVHLGPDADIDAPDAKQWLVKNLAWDRLDERYAKCIRTQYVNPADRVEFFRRTLRNKSPSFAHHGAALLMKEGILGPTCFTTNFDKLIENAFAIQGTGECQALRTGSEIQFWRPDPSRWFCVKLHGDYDTHNVLNTSEETGPRRPGSPQAKPQPSGTPRSCRAGFGRLRKEHVFVLRGSYDRTEPSSWDLDRGLLWGVYVGPKPAEPWDLEKTKGCRARRDRRGRRRRRDSENNDPDVQVRCSIRVLPVFGGGQFLMDIIEQSGRRGLIGQAEPYLDREMRIRRVFGKAKLSSARVDEHLRKLKTSTPHSGNAEALRRPVERAFELTRGDRRVWVAYGDIASRSYLGHAHFDNRLRAVVSPDDTFLSLGGGAAVSLAENAGWRSTIHEVSKFVPVPQGESRVTSAGNLPVHYIIHAATIEVSEAGYGVTREDVRRTFVDVLRRASALGVEVLSVPLLGAGVAGLLPEDSFLGLLEAYKSLPDEQRPAIVIFVVFEESQLSRSSARLMMEKTLDTADGIWSIERWPAPPPVR
jgi:O-acetyl-ADP-ribose deacetylase (regulator of RNase III)/NAD-dependent SIR2 family protein deacetylase